MRPAWREPSGQRMRRRCSTCGGISPVLGAWRSTDAATFPGRALSILSATWPARPAQGAGILCPNSRHSRRRCGDAG